MELKILNAKKKLIDGDIRQAEQNTGYQLPAEYRNFLLEHNGGHPEPSGFRIKWSGQSWAEGWDTGEVHYFLAIHDGDVSNFLEYVNDYQGRIPQATVPIGYDPGGNLILLGTAGANAGKVFFWAQDFETNEDREADYSNVGLVADSFNEFIGTLFEV